jgi:TetR/AcrR family transcriptional repressor of nem operon
VKYDDTDLLDRSYDLLWRDGCDSVSIRDLERALDLKAPSIYRRFHSRHELIARSVDRYTGRVVGGRIRRHLDATVDPVVGLRAFFTSAIEPAPGESVPRGCLLTLTAGQAACDHPGVRGAVDSGLVSVEAALRAQVHRAVGSGRAAPGADPEALATALFVAFEGLMVLARSGHSGLDGAVEQLLDACFPPVRSAVSTRSATARREDHDHE